MTIDTLEAIQAGGTTQWIRVRGADAANPVLLLIQQGPGLPMINEARRFEHKRLVWFDNSAHTPHLEEPGKFRNLLLLGIREPRMQQDVTADSGQPRRTQP